MFDDNERLKGLNNLLPYIELVVDKPSSIEGTIYYRSLNGSIHSNYWTGGFSVGDVWNWKEGGRNSYSLPGNVGYYLLNKQLGAWMSLGKEWDQVAEKLIKLKVARSAEASVFEGRVTDAIEQRIQAEKSGRARPNRTQNSQLGITAEILQDMRANSRF